jgi:hypothetical protein
MMGMTLPALIVSLVSLSLAASTITTTTSTTHTESSSTHTPVLSSEATIPITVNPARTTTVAFWANREGTTIAQYSYYAASVIYANSQSTIYNITCRTAASKCTVEPGDVTQGPSMFAFTGSSKAFSCTQTSDHANFNCMRSTSNDLHSTAYTIAANQLTQQPMLVTGGGEKLSGLTMMSTTFSAGPSLPTSSGDLASHVSTGWRLIVDEFMLAAVMLSGTVVVFA